MEIHLKNGYSMEFIGQKEHSNLPIKVKTYDEKHEIVKVHEIDSCTLYHALESILEEQGKELYTNPENPLFLKFLNGKVTIRVHDQEEVDKLVAYMGNSNIGFSALTAKYDVPYTLYYITEDHRLSAFIDPKYEVPRTPGVPLYKMPIVSFSEFDTYAQNFEQKKNELEQEFEEER